MGSDKLQLRFEGLTLLERALSATGGRPAAVVLGTALAESVILPDAAIPVLNDAPERGMSHSLWLANFQLGRPTRPLVVLLVDTPLVSAGLVEQMVRALGAADVAYPVSGERPGHPVVFGPRARARIAALPAGDTLRLLRDDPTLRARRVPTRDAAPFLDIDTPHDFDALRARRP